jgi:hypothetical protein
MIAFLFCKFYRESVKHFDRELGISNLEQPELKTFYRIRLPDQLLRSFSFSTDHKNLFQGFLL